MNESTLPESTQASRADAAPAGQGLGRASPVAIIATVVPIAGALATLGLGPLLGQWLRDQGTWGLACFTLVFTVAATLTLAPTYATSVIAGWTFGFQRGFPAVVIATVGGAMLCYLGARRLAGQRVQEAFRAHPRWDVVRRALLQENQLKTLWIVFLLRLSPVLPFGTTNVLLATTGVRLDVYILGTLLGLVPRTGLVALAAAGAGRLDFDAAESWWLFAAGVAAMSVCIGTIALIGRRALRRVTGEAGIEHCELRGGGDG